MPYDILVIDTTTDEVVHTFPAKREHIPNKGNQVWVPDNGEVAYLVDNVQFDYDVNEIRLMCKPNKKQSKQ